MNQHFATKQHLRTKRVRQIQRIFLTYALSLLSTMTPSLTRKTNKKFRFQKTLYFIIGSVDTFDRNLEMAQIDMGVARINFTSVVYTIRLDDGTMFLTPLEKVLLLTLFVFWILGIQIALSSGMLCLNGYLRSKGRIVDPSDVNVRFR